MSSASSISLTVCSAISITLPASTATSPPTTTPLPRLDIDAELYASEITKMSAKVSWRSFSDYELQYIDGVQVKYTQKNNLVCTESYVSVNHSRSISNNGKTLEVMYSILSDTVVPRI